MLNWSHAIAAALAAAIGAGAGSASGPTAFARPVTPPDAVQQAVPEQESPDSYAEWGNLAMREASKKKYQIQDYKYVGKKIAGPDRVERTFKFWVKKKGEEFGLYVTVAYKESTKELLDIKFRESKQ
jgi:hypothetical protein